MSLPLSPNVQKAVERLFSVEKRSDVVELLTQECAENLPNCGDENEYGIEDLRFAVLKLSLGDVGKLRDAVQLANEDWRDLLSAAGSVRKYKGQLLNEALERNPMSDGVQYAHAWHLFAASVTFVSMIIARLCQASAFQAIGVVLSIVAIYMLGPLFIRPLRALWNDGGAIFLFVGGAFIGIPAALGYFGAGIALSLLGSFAMRG